MRKLSFDLVIALAFLALPAAHAVAGPIGSTGSFSLTRVEDLRDGAGGEFTVYDVKDATGQPSNALSNASYSADPATKDVPNPFPGGVSIPNSFQTFCLEMDEDALMVTTNYFVVGSAAAAGGNGATNGRDPLSVGTAWLYSQFAQGLLNVAQDATNLAGNYFSSDAPLRRVEAGYLQKAIWWLEQEAAPLASKKAENPYYQAALANFGGEANAQAAAEVGAYGVYAINNFKTAAARDKFIATKDIFQVARADRGQDFLYYDAVSVPDGGATAMLLGMSLIALGALRRKQ